MAFLMPVSRRLATRLATPTTICRQCVQSRPAIQSRSLVLEAVRASRAPAAPFQARLQSTKATVAELSKAASEESASAYASAVENAPSRKRLPEHTTSKAVTLWLLGSAVSVFGIVIFGGLTRLTESGLSITEWRPVTGSLPPKDEDAWNSEFEKYRASPEFKLLNPNMTLEEFKKIYFMEWFHRVWGRVIGVTFVLPAIYFVARRRVSLPMAFNLAGISALIGFQGVIGWWMVKSGLKDDLFAPGSHPRVSQYRLAAHLSAAVLCYSWMLLSGLTVLRTRRLLADPTTATNLVAALKNPALSTLRRSVGALTGLVALTIVSGALVAGLDAGLIYNEFPQMGVGLTPPAAELWDAHYSRKQDRSDLWWRNMLENPSTVQLDHRILATSTFFSIVALFMYARRSSMKSVVPANARRGVMGLLHLSMAQVTLGISTLIYMVPLPLAAMHQAGALALLTGALVLGHRLRVPKSLIATLNRRVKMAQANSARK
ncbi:probable COX15 - cytochrome oxidase assembly factor [Cephalotrichum gorgonifer]|uniref:Probable COX15 - cytochrome oxidase assembly factor n=1 Tax=Cephalotrichum gorgonifer TaxID=2041049 RepID=A0AAE8N247_9PEZI|nr:probable COX15 - cytochrome oxidase assembly factor [Cephalotrichum gorgonifer]